MDRDRGLIPCMWNALVCMAALPVQATARTYEEALEEAVDVAEEKLLSGRQSAQDADDRDAEEQQRKELQAWDDRFEKDSEKERDTR